MVIYLVFLVIGLVPLSPEILIALPIVVVIAANGLFLGLWLGIAVARFRDVQPFVNSILGVIIFFTPVFYHLDNLSSGLQIFVLIWNPFTYLIEAFRAPLIGAPLLPFYYIGTADRDADQRRSRARRVHARPFPASVLGGVMADDQSRQGSRPVRAAVGPRLQPEASRGRDHSSKGRPPGDDRRPQRHRPRSSRTARGSGSSAQTAQASRRCSRSWRVCCRRRAAASRFTVACSRCSAARRRASTRRRRVATTSSASACSSARRPRPCGDGSTT